MCVAALMIACSAEAMPLSHAHGHQGSTCSAWMLQSRQSPTRTHTHTRTQTAARERVHHSAHPRAALQRSICMLTLVGILECR